MDLTVIATRTTTSSMTDSVRLRYQQSIFGNYRRGDDMGLAFETLNASFMCF